MKLITKYELKKLIEMGVLKGTHFGYVDPKYGNQIGVYKTRGGKIYAEDAYADYAKELLEE